MWAKAYVIEVGQFLTLLGHIVDLQQHKVGLYQRLQGAVSPRVSIELVRGELSG